MQTEAILKPKKGSRTKRKKEHADEELDGYADEELFRLREAISQLLQITNPTGKSYRLRQN